MIRQSGAADSAAPGQLLLCPLLRPLACVKGVHAVAASLGPANIRCTGAAPLGRGLCLP